QAAIEAAGAKQRRIERVAAVRRRDQQDVVVLGTGGRELPVRRQVAVHERDQLGLHPVAPRWLIERLHLDQELVDHAATAAADERRGRPPGLAGLGGEVAGV